jgi:hypothetical protein
LESPRQWYFSQSSDAWRRKRSTTTRPWSKNSPIVLQPGKKPPLIDDGTGPGNSVAHRMDKDGEHPRVHVNAPAESDADAEKA